MNENGKEYVMRMAREHGVKFIRLWFTDILGFLKSFAITVEELEEALADGKGFDGSSIEGFARIDESDMVAMPDPEHLLHPALAHPQPGWSGGGPHVLRHPPAGRQPLPGGPALRARSATCSAPTGLGYTYYVGPELEYFYFKSNSIPPEVLDHGGYFDLTPLDVATDLRRDTVLTLESMGIAVEYSHHEVAPSQHEIDLRYDDALTHGRQHHDLPAGGQGGRHEPRGLRHLHAQAARRERQRHAHSPVAVQWRAQPVLRPARTSTSSRRWARLSSPGCCGTPRSSWRSPTSGSTRYKRLVPGYESPAYLSWAMRNRANLIRVPRFNPQREEAARAEFRAPDPACNPYLALRGDARRRAGGDRARL